MRMHHSPRGRKWFPTPFCASPAEPLTSSPPKQSPTPSAPPSPSPSARPASPAARRRPAHAPSGGHARPFDASRELVLQRRVRLEPLLRVPAQALRQEVEEGLVVALDRHGQRFRRRPPPPALG